MNRDLALAGGLALLAHAGAALCLRGGPINTARVDVGMVTVTPVTIVAARWESLAPAEALAESPNAVTEHELREEESMAAQPAERRADTTREQGKRPDIIRLVGPVLERSKSVSREVQSQVTAAEQWTRAGLATLVRGARAWLTERQATAEEQREATSAPMETAPASPGVLPRNLPRPEEITPAPPQPGRQESGAGSGSPAFTPAAIVRNEPPVYPTVARRRGYSGTVELRVEVLPDGAAGRIELLKSSGYDVLDDAAMTSVRQWRFRPASRGGVHEASWIEVPVIFRLERVGD